MNKDLSSPHPPSGLGFSSIVRTFAYSDQHAKHITKLAESWPRHVSSSDAVAALACWIARDLFSPSSDTRDNLERIAFGLETASGELVSLTARMRDTTENIGQL